MKQNFKECRYLIYSDLNATGGVNLLCRLLFNPSFQVTFWYRIARYLMLKHSPMYYPAALMHRHYGHKYGIGLPVNVEVGEGLCFAHFNCIFIGAERIGRNLTMYQGCTIGAVHGKGAPSIGDNVLMYAGSKIVGKVRVGNNVVVGANAVVVSDVPDNAVVVGVPAKVVSYNASKITQHFRR